MSIESLHIVRAIALDLLADLLATLEDLVDRPRGLEILVARMGWRLDGLIGADPTPLLESLHTVKTTIETAVTASSDMESAAAGAQMVDAVERMGGEWDAFQQAWWDQLQAGPSGLLDEEIATAFLLDLQEYLLLECFRRRGPGFLHLGEALGVLRWERADPIDLGGTGSRRLRYPVVRCTLPLLRILSLAANPLALLEADGVGTAIAAVGAELQRILQALAERLEDFSLGDTRIRLRPDAIELIDFYPPLLQPGMPPATLSLPIPVGPAPELSLTITPDRMRFAWGDPGPMSGTGFPLFETGGFQVLAGGYGGADDPPPSLTLALSSPPEIVLSGALGVRLPLSWISDETGGAVQLRAGGSLRYALDGSLEVVIDLVSLAIARLRLAGAGGPTIELASLRLRDLRFPLIDLPRLDLSGVLTLGGARVEMATSLDRDAFAVRSSAAVELPGGLRFEPLGDTPVLSFRIPLGGTGLIEASIAGGVQIPDEGGLESVRFSGSLALLLDGDILSVQSVDAAAEIGASWVLPGAIEIQEAGLALAYQAGRFSVRISGKIGLGEGTLTLEKAEFLHADDAVSLDLVQAVSGTIGLAASAQLRGGTVHLLARATTDGSELSGSLSIASGAADVVQSDSRWLVSIDRLNASVRVDAGFQLVAESGIISFVKPFAADPADAAGRVSIGIDAFELSIQPGSISFAGAWSLEAPLDLWDNAGFRLAVDAGSGFGLSLGAGNTTRMTIDGGVQFHVSEEALTSLDPVGQVSAGIAGTTTIVLGPAPSITFDNIDLTLGPGTFRLGDAQAMTLSNATVTLAGLDRIGRSTADEPFEVRLSGRLQLADGGPALGLQDFAFVFVGRDLPLFQPGDVSVETGSFGDDLPFRVTAARFELVDSALPFPQSLHYTNLRIGMSVALELPIGSDDDAAGFRAQADNLFVDLSTEVPRVTLDGIGMGVDGLSVGPIEATGLLYVGGLGSLASLPAQITGGLPVGMRPFFVAGKLGGRYNGTKLNLLLAMRPDRPLGACIDMAVDGGITLWYGFTLNGASGGVCFANQPSDPCALKSYLSFPDDVSEPPTLDDSGWQPQGEEYAFEGARATTPDTGCQCDCPPPSMNPLCQPHPDGTLYPGRAILKLSAIDEATLEDWGVLALADGIGADVQAGVDSLLERLRTRLAEMVPAVPAGFDFPRALPDELVAIARNPVDAMVDSLRPRLLSALQGAGASIRERCILALGAGIECPDVTVQLTGTFSYTGIGYFLTVTGGVNIGTTGAGGIIGSVNVFGIPIGRLRAFASGTDENGQPRFALCGDMDVSFGPFEFGRLCLTATAPSLELVCLQALQQHLPALVSLAGTEGPALLAKLLDDVDSTTSSTSVRIAELDVEGAVSIVNRLSAQGFQSAQALQDWSGGVFTTIWDGFEPTVDACGLVQPKVFGLPLLGQLASLSMSVRKERLTALVTVPLSRAIASLAAGAYAAFLPSTDYATVAVRCGFPDPVKVGIQTYLGFGRDPGAFFDSIATEVDRMLEETLFAVGLEVSPFGLELADVQSRVLLPDLLNYPADPWTPPDGRPALLAACLAHDLLVDPEWTGDLEVLGRAGEDLRRHWFPHGGWLGAGTLKVPRLLVDDPPLELFDRIVENDDVLDRLGALSALVNEYLTQPEELGAVSFYVPAPSPPASDSGTLLDRLGHLAEHAQVGAVRSDLFFGSGEVVARLFGVDLGHMACHLELPGLDAPGRLVLEGEIGDAWLEALVGRVACSVEVTTPPPLPIRLYFELARRLLALALRGRLTPLQFAVAIANAAAAHVDDRERSAEVRATLRAAFASVPTTGATADRNAALAAAIADALAAALPKIALTATASGLHLPPPLHGLLTVQWTRVAAFSPFYDPAVPDDDIFAETKRFGGVGVEVTGAALDLWGWKATFDVFGISVRAGPGAIPLVSGTARASGVALPGLDLLDAHLSFANTDQALAGLAIRARALDMGWASLLPSDGRADFSIRADVLLGTAAISPARLVLSDDLDSVTAEIGIHGATKDDDFSFSPTEQWGAHLEVASLSLQEPATGTTWIASDIAAAEIQGIGLSLDRVEGRVSFEVGSVGPLVISGVTLFPSIRVDTAVRLDGHLEGFDAAITGRAAGGLDWHGHALSFDTGDFTVEATAAGLLEAARSATLDAFRDAFLSFDLFVDAVTDGWVPWGFDPAAVVALLTRVYGIRDIGEVVSALGRLPIDAAQSASVLDLLFHAVPHADLAAIPHQDRWFGHLDQVRHADATSGTHGDQYLGMHLDRVTHADIPQGHGDLAGLHLDDAVVPHLDAEARIHGDITPRLHADLSGVGHIDTAPGPHADFGFGPSHADTFVPPHGDIAGAHADVTAVPHLDVSAQPHADVSAIAHADLTTPHGDGPVPPPHTDSSIHGDKAPIHLDSAGIHIDEGVHFDVAGVHSDIGQLSHSDSPAHQRSRNEGSGHGDAPAVPHADRAGVPHQDSDARLPWHLDTLARRHGDVTIRHGDHADHGDVRTRHGDIPGSHGDHSDSVRPSRPIHNDRIGPIRPPGLRPSGGGISPRIPVRRTTQLPQLHRPTVAPRIPVPPPGGSGPTHLDTRTRHADTPAGHLDRSVHLDREPSHLDQADEPHGDAPPPASPHLDVGPVPHGDQRPLPHADTARRRS